MASRRGLTIGGLALAGGASYYMYQAGGNPKVAEKEFEHDAAKLSSKMKGELPGREKEAKTQAKVYGEEAGQKIDAAWADARAKANETDAKLQAYAKNAGKTVEEYRKEAGKELNQAVDNFDKTVEQKAAQSKSWFRGWFGGN